MRAFSIFSVPQALDEEARLCRRHMLARLGLAWLIMMQVMMFAFPGYLRTRPMSPDDHQFLDHAIVYMNWISLFLTIPVVWYCAWPVWAGATRRIRQASVSMDVPVALGIIAAFIPSVYATYTGRGEVYFESVSMFVAFLLTARYFELCARQAISSGQSHAALERYRQVLTRRSDQLAVWFTVLQLVLALLVGAIWYSYAPERAVAVMVAMLVISCPCAMAMAVPTAAAAAHASLARSDDNQAVDITALQQATGHVARQNLYGSMVWHLLMMPLAAIGLIQPWLAALVMLFSSLAVAANSWRLARYGRFASPVQPSSSLIAG